MNYFEDKLFEWIASNGLLDGADRVLAAVSGGADSAVMIRVLHRLRQAGRLSCEFVIGHVNHGLRGADSDADEAFVGLLGERLNVDVVTARVPVREYAAERKFSIETAGRMLRLQKLAVMAGQTGCDVIATAHHADDQAETLIHRLMRGTGFRGLCGIHPVSIVYGAKFIRPLLTVRRSEIIRYASANGIHWRDDASNSNIGLTRNRIRHRLLPELATECGEIVSHLFALSQKSLALLEHTETQAQLLIEQGRLDADKQSFEIEQGVLYGCPPWVFYEALRDVLVRLGVGLRNYGREHFEGMRLMLEQNAAKGDFPGGVEVDIRDGRVCIRCNLDDATGGQRRSHVILPIGQKVQFGKWSVSAKRLGADSVDLERFLRDKNRFVEWIDADTICGEIVIRGREDGDRFWPIGAGGEKKAGRFLMDGGFNGKTKEEAFVIADSEKILWLAPLRMSDAVKVTPKTTRILEIRLEQ